MALSDRNIVITPNKSKSDDPKIVFSGANAAVSAQNVTLRVYPDNAGTLSFEGSAGQLFSITNSLTGTIFSVNDVSGMPSISVDSSGIVLLAPFGGKVGVGTASSFGLTSNVFSLYGTAMVYGNLDLANPAGGTSGIYFNDGTYLSSATAFSGALTLTSAAPQITLNNGTSNWIQWASAGVAAPAFTTRSLGTKLVLYPNIGGSTVDFALGIDNDTLWNSVPTTSGLFKWYGGTTLAATLTGAGALTTTTTTTSTAFIPSGSTVPTNGMFLPATNSVGFSTNSGEKMRIEANGRVGIGTSAPNSVFNVNATTVPLFQTSNAQIGGNNFEILVGNSVVHGVTLGYVNNTTVPYGYISAGTSTRNIIVAANGRVGIGGAAVPQTLLDVGGGAVFGATWAGNTNFINPPTNGLSVQGSVGVGTYTPLSTLDVNGVASFRSAISTASTATVASLVSNGAVSGTTGTFTGALYGASFNTAGAATVASLVSNGTISTATADTATTASHYYVETASDNIIRPKTLANARTEIVTTAAVNAAAATTVGTITSGVWNAGAVTSSGIVTGTRLVSTIATGTAPLGVTSTTVVANLNSDLLDGLHLNTSGRANLANEVVRTDASGYIQAGWINTTSGDNGTTAIDRVYASSDGYIRYYTPANFRTVLNVPTRTGGDASGTWAIGISGTAATATNSSYCYNYTQSFNTNWNTDFAAAPAGSMILRGDTSSGSATGGPGGSWWFQQNFRHANGTNVWGTQIAWGWEDNANLLRTRNITAGTYGAWITYLNSNNYSSYALPLSGGTMSGTITFGNGVGSMLIGTNGGLTRGYLYNDAAGFGILNNGGGWAARIEYGTNTWNVFGEVTAYASDQRLKTNIVPISNALDKIMRLNGVMFDWDMEKSESVGFKPTDKHDVGVLAQQVEAVLPEAVRPAPFDRVADDNSAFYSKSGENYLTVQYEKLTALLIEAVKDQQKMIDDLKARVSVLESAKN